MNLSHPKVSFGLSLKALSFHSCNSVLELQAYLKQTQKPIYILGGGTNILPVGYLNADLLRPDLKGIRYEDAGDHVLVTAGAGVGWHELVLDTLEKGCSGLENLSLIPGSVGAAPIQNIGAYGVELSDRLVDVETLDIQTQTILMLSNEECEFAYRDSIFKNELKGRVIITHVTLRLDKAPQLNLSYGNLAKELEVISDTPSARQVSDAVIKIRQSKLPDPGVIGNAGSFFKNPVIDAEQYKSLVQEFPDVVSYKLKDGYKLAAGWLIDQCDLKGYRQGDAGVHDKQALVIVNHGDARADEILSVAAFVQHQVFHKYQVRLQPEVQIVGDKQLIGLSGLQIR